MCGEAGAIAVAAHGWVSIPNASLAGFQFLLNGTTGAHCTVKLQAALNGGEDDPIDLATADATGAVKWHQVADKVYDKYRINVTAYTAPGLGSQVILSAR